MGYGCRHNFSIVIERYDLDGVLNVLRNRYGRMAVEDIDADSYAAGAYHALNMLRNHEWRDQSEYFTIFDSPSSVRSDAYGDE